jgi:hypothetical protein
MVARFTKDKYGWRCTEVFPDQKFHVPVCYATFTKALYVNVTRAPRLGFSKRPHHYI